MEVVLLERVEKLGQMGEVVRVKPGYARNFLLPLGKALRATKENIRQFEESKAQLEAQNLERRQDAEAVAEKLNGQSFIAIRQSSQTGQLYGSVTARDLATLITEGGFTVLKGQVFLAKPIKELGLHDVRIDLHPEVPAMVQVNVARSEEEAERQARGENVIGTMDDEDDDDDLDIDALLDEDLDDEEGDEREGETSEDAGDSADEDDASDDDTKTN